MTRWAVTLSQPAGATPAIAPVALTNFGADGYGRSPDLPNSWNGYTLGGQPRLIVRPRPIRYRWTATIIDKESDVLAIEALIRWQQQTFQDGGDGRLVLSDEVEYLIPEATQSKTVLPGTTRTVSANTTTGFGQFFVLAFWGDNHRQHRGQWQAAEPEPGKELTVEFWEA